MASQISSIKSVINGYYRVLQVLVTALMGIMIVPVSLQIFSRYVGFIPRYIWTEEAARFCFIWIIMTGASIAVRDGTHFEVEILPQAKTARGKLIGQMSVIIGMMFMALTFLYYGYGYAAFGYRQTSELTGINMVLIHGVYLLAGLSWTVFLIERAVDALAQFRGGHHDAR